MENKKNSNFEDMFKPIIVLVLICLVTTALLAVTYGVTDPIIKDNNAKAANEARNVLLPSAESSFEEYTGELYVMEEGKVYVSECYKATNGSGEVVTVKTNSYGGVLTMMVGIDQDGVITSVLVTEASDTPGVGTRAQAEGHLGQYTDKSELADQNVKKDATINHVTGASVSSTAIHKGVWCALEQHKLMGGAN
ncbi:MAG: FMN-binding protein [Mogibacterium sp.]|nr:FMN-binding protein [Mogibacterium sp.]